MSKERRLAEQQELDNDQMEQVAGGIYRPTHSDDGTTEHFFTVEIGEGLLASTQRVRPVVVDPAS